ncbi:AAA domain-containing protein [Labedaea rhizosphaerae]|uniref:Uncharacterized protein DUF559 n=1 Tax=Labedaea rhizosphaerae TaxID=598644 RepID=A0A4R6SCV7_LABRH|nr:AAA domain-containing protein [Labedaea rhizosphaerae]TDP97443.1 uncharacterized protein DUF559 [Labedaea rhizosphaerae]
MLKSGDQEALRKSVSLMDYLAEVTDSAERDPVRDVLSDEAGVPEQVLWLDDLPDGVRYTPTAGDDVLLRVSPPRTEPEPKPPAQIAGWIDLGGVRGFQGREPRLAERGPSDAEVDEQTAPPNSVVRAFTLWLSAWRTWADKRRRTEGRRQLYEQLERAAKIMEQQDDVYEFVLGSGLVCWASPDGERIRRHIVTEAVAPKLDRRTAEVTVTLGSGKRRMEDKELFGGQDAYLPERGRTAREAIVESDVGILDQQFLELVKEWLSVSLDVPFAVGDRRAQELPDEPTVSRSPALLLRPRSRVLLAEAYRRIAEALRQPDAQVPVALTQLVMDTEREQRTRWLQAQGASSGDVLGGDPLFPLPTNDEQLRVIDLLRTETGIVVQGPPGTGKTHTIANLVSALLARGQRVLVTSQKDQALRVLREKIPPELRRLCVLLAGGTKDAAKELEQGLEALSEAQASAETARLPDKIAELRDERKFLRSRSAELNNRIRELRDVENVEHGPIAPGFSTDLYRGTLTDIVRDVKANAAAYDWMPAVDPAQPDTPPFSVAEFAELIRLLRDDSPGRRQRPSQLIPSRQDLPGVPQLASIVHAERQARDTAHEDTSELTQRLAAMGQERLDQLSGLRDQLTATVQWLGIGTVPNVGSQPEWIFRAVADRLADRNGGVWGQLLGVAADAGRLQQQLQAQGVRFAVDLPPLDQMGIGTARRLLNTGRKLREHLLQGKKLRKVLPKSAAQKDAAEFLEVVRVDGEPPTEVAKLEAALERLEAEVAAAQLVGKWADARVDIPTVRLAQTLSDLDDNGRRLAAIDQLGTIKADVVALLASCGLMIDLSSLASLQGLLDAVPPALKYVALEQARNQVELLRDKVGGWAGDASACPELAILVTAIADRDLDNYGRGLEALDAAGRERANENRRAQLIRVLRSVHPRLADLMAESAHDPVWDHRTEDVPAAWAWSKAHQFVQRSRNAEQERKLSADFDSVEDQIKRVTERLAATEALHACMARMSDTHARALRTYREHMSHVGAGSGMKTREFRKAARAAMEKAKDAVPAWVVPLPNLLDNIAANRDSFDVVIVDEASQVGLEHLFLLWMAPRVIVVGDDKQCTPGGNRMGPLNDLFEHMGEYLREIEPEIRLNFTSKSNLYGLLSARSGKDAVVRLREHFRCMPEIINWSSTQFYGEHDRPGLVPLRERTAADLEPLKVVQIIDAYTEGKNQNRRNPIEAKRIVAQLVECLNDPAYKGKTFGIVVLMSSTSHVKLLDHEIIAATTPEQREDHKIRVGTAPNFQGDERDVIFLSTVVTEAPRAQSSLVHQQSYNVAASRAKDQMWLFTSVPQAELKAADLRTSLLNYMLAPPSVFGASPGLEDVSATKPCDPFESLFEQRIFRELKQRGYYTVPQYKVGTRTLDIVVVGDGGRLAVECDGHFWHTSARQQISDARRDRELQRMGWEVMRIRESEYEFDPERELAPLWTRLTARGIQPRDPVDDARTDWQPIQLAEDDGDLEADIELSGVTS